MTRIDKYPLVSCIMPTYNRRRFLPQAVAYFLRQDYPNRELVIVDDGTDAIQDLVPDDSRLRYLRLDRKYSIGTKRNLACQEAQGEIIAHWDDDDWMADWRLRYQVEQLITQNADICGTNKLLFYDVRSQKLWLYECPISTKTWLAGGTLCYRKSFWLTNTFEDINVGEDTRFVWKKPLENVLVLPDFTFYVAIIHSGNTSPKALSSSCWKRWHANDIQHLMNGDWKFYSHINLLNVSSSANIRKGYL